MTLVSAAEIDIGKAWDTREYERSHEKCPGFDGCVAWGMSTLCCCYS